MYGHFLDITMILLPIIGSIFGIFTHHPEILVLSLCFGIPIYGGLIAKLLGFGDDIGAI